MLSSLRQIKSRIRSVENTRKVTRALEMISVSKLRRHRELRARSVRYAEKLEGLLRDILSDEKATDHPLLKEIPDGPGLALCVVTSDTGLCGTYNHTVLRAAEEFLHPYDPRLVRLVTLGRKGFIYFKKQKFNIVRSFIGLNGRYTGAVAGELLDSLTRLFLSGEVQGVYLAYAQVASASRYTAVLEKILNIEAPRERQDRHIFEPTRDSILEEVISQYLFFKIKGMLLHAFTSEHQARAIAMGEATQNAGELLEKLIMQRNKVRQSSITKEILEIISSAEALKG